MTDDRLARPTTAPGSGHSHEETASRGRTAAVWNAVTAAIGAIMGLLPHVLHHATLFAGAALVTTSGGNLLFGAVGLLLSVPLLRRLYRRFGTWKAPAIGVALFTVMFSLSAFVIGPAISGNSPTETPEPASPTTPTEHTTHHPG